MDQDETYHFLQCHYDKLLQDWEAAEAEGHTDLVFMWIVGKDDFTTSWAPREEVYAKFKDEPFVPEYTRNQLSRPAGPNRAWMIFTDDQISASLRVTRVAVNGSGGSA